MAFFDEAQTSGTWDDARRALMRKVKAVFDTPFDRRARRMSRRIEQLRALDDAQLDELGLTRDQIIPYAFGTRDKA